MKIGLIDVDGHNFPNLSLMKISAACKQVGREVEWYNPDDYYFAVYKSKIFSFSEDKYPEINAMHVIKGGSGYAIKIKDGKEFYDLSEDWKLPAAFDRIYPDYSLYPELTKDTAYGMLTRGCPRGCAFCHTGMKDGRKSIKVADLQDFWIGQKNLVLLDQNILACTEWKDLLQQVIDSKAITDFNGGIDIRLMTPEKAEMLMQIKTKIIHFAFDRYEDKEIVKRKLTEFKDISGYGRHKIMVYVLVNYNTTFEQDLERVMFIRSLDFQPYIMRYDREHIPRGHKLNALARWVNFIPLFWKYETFEDYMENHNK